MPRSRPGTRTPHPAGADARPPTRRQRAPAADRYAPAHPDPPDPRCRTGPATRELFSGLLGSTACCSRPPSPPGPTSLLTEDARADFEPLIELLGQDEIEGEIAERLPSGRGVTWIEVTEIYLAVKGADTAVGW